MSELKATPGPWKVDGDEIQCAKDSSFICTVTGGDEDQDEADRNLISAAPCMYEALESLLANLAEGDFISESRIDAAKAALAKARGEQS